MGSTGTDYLIELLERKNLCFRSFHKLCESFLDEIAKGEVENLESFQKKRQGLINVLEQLEFEVTHWLDSYKSAPEMLDGVMTDKIKNRVNQLLKDKDLAVRAIIDLDLQILGHIDRIKDQTIQKLQSVQNGRRTVGAYRSPLESVEIAESKKSLDQEA